MEDSKELEELHMSGIEMAATGKETRRAPRPLSPKGQMENAQGLNILCPKNSPGKNTAVGSHSLFQGLFPTQGSNLGLQHCRHSLQTLNQHIKQVSLISKESGCLKFQNRVFIFLCIESQEKRRWMNRHRQINRKYSNVLICWWWFRWFSR